MENNYDNRRSERNRTRYKTTMHFDHIIMNPPYNGSLHLKILSEAMKHSDDVVNLSPIRWLQDPLAEYKKNSDWKTYKNIREKIENIEVVPKEEFYQMFDISSSLDLGIYHITKNGGWNNVFLNECHILSKALSKDLPLIKDFIEEEKLDGYRVRILLRAPIETDRQTSMSVITRKQYMLHYKLSFVYKDGYSVENGKFWTENRLPGAGNKTYPVGTPIHSSIKFDTEDEAKSFEAYTKTKFFRYIFSKEKVGDATPTHLPFMPTYKHEWTDEMLYEYFGLTKDEIKEIEQGIKQLCILTT